MKVNYKEIFDVYKAKYLDKDYSEILSTARDIISDYHYLTEHLERTKRSKFPFSFQLQLATPGLIHNFFFLQIGWQEMRHYMEKEDNLVTLLEIYYLTARMIEIAKESWKEKSIKELLEFAEVTKWYIGIELDEYLGAFVGCSHAIDMLQERIGKAKSNKPIQDDK